MTYLVILLFFTSLAIRAFPTFAVAAASINSFYDTFKIAYDICIGPFEVLASVRNGLIGDASNPGFWLQFNTWLGNVLGFSFNSIISSFFEIIFGFGYDFIEKIKIVFNDISGFSTNVSNAVSNAFEFVRDAIVDLTNNFDVFSALEEVLNKIKELL